MIEWKPIKGYKGLYKISSLGQVRRIDTGLILKYCINSSGYPVLNLCRDGIQKLYLLHRLIALAFIPNPENKPHVNHKNSVRTDFSINNLEWVTSSENIQHAYDNGRMENNIEAARKASIKAHSKPVSWIHDIYGIEFLSATDLIRKYPLQKLHRGHLSSVSTGKRKHHKGWRLHDGSQI